MADLNQGQAITAPPELLHNLRLWLRSIGISADSVDDASLGGMVCSLGFARPEPHILGGITESLTVEVTLAGDSTVDFSINGAEWPVLYWAVPDIPELCELLGVPLPEAWASSSGPIAAFPPSPCPDDDPFMFRTETTFGEDEMERRVQEILNTHGQNVPPIDPVAIAHGLGFEVRSAQFRDPNVSGVLRRDAAGARPQILVNRSDSPVRQRYTVAHELGHAILHKDEESDFVDRERDLSALFRLCDEPVQEQEQERRRREIQANMFAANLLMPRELVQQVLSDTEDIGDIARIFQVSRAAVGYRIANLGL